MRADSVSNVRSQLFNSAGYLPSLSLSKWLFRITKAVSLLFSFGVAGGDINIGAANHVGTARSEEFAATFNLYFNNNTGRFSWLHSAAPDLQKIQEIGRIIAATLAAKVLTAYTGPSGHPGIRDPCVRFRK